METISLYGKEYQALKTITADCGCVFKKNNCEVGVSYSDVSLCIIHTPILDIESVKHEKTIELKKYVSKKISYEWGDMKNQSNINDETVIVDNIYDIANGDRKKIKKLEVTDEKYSKDVKQQFLDYKNEIFKWQNEQNNIIKNINSIEELNSYNYEFIKEEIV